MKNYSSILMILFLFIGTKAEVKYQNKQIISTIIARPIDAGSSANKSKDLWTVALLDRFFRFRLEPLHELDIVSSVDLEKVIPDQQNFLKTVNDADYFEAAKKLKIPYILFTRFEISPKTKSLQLYIEIQSTKDLEIVAQQEKDIPLDSLSSGIDSCLIRIVKKMNKITSNDAIRFLQIPIISNNYKHAKRLGELFIEEHSSSSSTLFKEYEKIIDKDPYMLLAYNSAGYSGLLSKNYDKASKYFKQLLDLAPLHTEIYYPLAKSYRYAGRFNEALSTVVNCERLQLKSVDLLLEKAFIYEGMNQRGYALSIHKQILSLDSMQPVSLLYLSKENNNAAQSREALQLSNRLIKSDPTNGYAFYENSRSLSALKQYAKAFESGKKAADLLPNDPLIQEWLGDLYLKDQKFFEASKSYHIALQFSPDNFQLYIKTARSMSFNNHTFDALSLLRRIEQRFADKPVLKKEIGLLEFSEGNVSKSIPLLESYVVIVPEDSDALLALGKMYIQTADYNKAVSILNKALQTTADKIVCRLFLASAYLNTKDYVSARKLLEQVIAEKPLKDAHRMMAEQYLASGDMRNALTHFQKERELHGESVSLQEYIALLHFKLGFFAPAKKEFTHLIKIAPKHAYALYYVAIIHLREGDIKNAEKYLEDAKKLSQGTEEIFYQLGMYYKTQNVFDKAINAYNNSLTINSTSEKSLIGCSEAYGKIGNDSAVAELFIKLFNVNNSKYEQKLAEAGHLFLKKNLPLQAENVYSQFLSKGFKDFSVNVSYASILYKKKDYLKVIDLLKNVDQDWMQNEQVALMLADSYNKTNNFPNSIQWCKVLLEKNQNDRIAIRIAANSYEMIGDTISSLSMYERYLKLPVDEFRAAFLFHSGELYEIRDMNSNAIARFEMAIKEFPDDLRNHDHLGTIYMKNKQYTHAHRVLKDAVEFPHASPKLQKMLAQTNVALNQLDDAEQLYCKYLARAGNDAEAWKDLSSIYFTRNQFSLAINPLIKSTELKPDNFECHQMLGISYIKLKNYSKAITPLGHARTINKNDVGIIELSAQCYRNLNETTSLSALLREWLAIDPNRFDTKMELGQILLEEKNISEAIKMFEDAARFIPTEAGPYLSLAKAYEIQDNDSIRLHYLNQAQKYSNSNWEIPYQLARYYISKNINKSAEEQFLLCVDLNPSNAQIHFEYGNLLSKQGNYTSALSEYNAALAIEPNNPFYMIHIAFSLSKTGNQKSGLENCKVALSKNSSDPKILYWAGLTFIECNNKQSAYAMYNNAIQLDSSFSLAYEALGDLFISDFRYSEASKNYFKAWEKGGYNETRAFKLGNSLSYNRKYIESMDFFETILNRNPSHEIALYKVIESCSEIDNINKARKLLRQFKPSDSPWMQLAQGKIYEKEKNYEAALTAYSIAEKITPDHPFVHAGLGRVYLSKAIYDSAINHLSLATMADSLNMQYILDLGVAFEKTGDKNSAYLYFCEVDKKYPQHPDVHALMAQIKIEQKEFNTAVNILGRGIEYHTSNSYLYLLLGRTFEEQKHYERAIECYQTALKKGDNCPVEALLYIGNIYYEKLINDKKAKEYYKRYVKAGGVNEAVLVTMKKIE